MKLRSLADDALALIAPSHCPACGDASGADREGLLCPPCRGRMPWLPIDTACHLCDLAWSDRDRAGCPGCAQRGSRLSGVRAAVDFADPAVDFVHRLKYPAPGLAGLDPRPKALLGALLAHAALLASEDPPQEIVPIPLHTRRLRARGFNPALLLARELRRRYRIPLRAGWLLRTRDTPSQTSLERRPRLANVRGAFTCRPRARVPTRVWLVDDVVTTGATLDAAAEALAQAGVESIVGLCVARTPYPTPHARGRSGPTG